MRRIEAGPGFTEYRKELRERQNHEADYPPFGRELNAEDVQEYTDTLSDLKAHLQAYIEARPKIALHFFAEMTHDEGLQKILVTSQTSRSPKEVQRLFLEGKIPDDCLRNFILQRAERIARLQESFAEQQHALKTEVFQKIDSARQRGLITITAERLQSRFNEIQFLCGDSLRLPFEEPNEAGHDPELRRIVVSAELLQPGNEDKLAHVVLHEAIHGVSARTVTIEGKEVRSGTTFYSGHKEGDRVRFEWLKEGFTERLTTRIDNNDSEYYIAEIELLNTLERAGISAQLLQEAFFEEATDEGHATAWRKLSQDFRKAFPSSTSGDDFNFLVRLDKFLETHPVEVANDLIEAGRWQEIVKATASS